MYILGISGGLDFLEENHFQFPVGALHDSAAVLLHNGEVVAGIEEERLSRIKHTNRFPSYAIQFCLEKANITLKDIDYVSWYASEKVFDQVLLEKNIREPKAGDILSIRKKLQSLLFQIYEIEISTDKFFFQQHHLSHAASTYYLSGYQNSLVLTVDGAGESVSTQISWAKNGELNEVLLTENESNSLGHLYFTVTQIIGFKEFDEYKVMGLAPYGNSQNYVSIFEQCFVLKNEGKYQIDLDKVLNLKITFLKECESRDAVVVQQDFAASLQFILEKIIFHSLTYFQEITGEINLCIAGGVGQNSRMNGKILTSGLFNDVFVQPASSDCGCALGAALLIAQQHNPMQILKHVYWGSDVSQTSDNELERELDRWKLMLKYSKQEEICEVTAELLAENYVIGWVQGASEFGPRALGNRSILGNPTYAENKDIINKMIKKREAFRPFAPSILEEDVEDFFELYDGKTQYPYMTFVLDVCKDKRELLGAIVHVDGSARLQTVNKETNRSYWKLINAFKQRTGIPILLNTSFNNNFEPIVDSIYDAIVCFLTSGLNYLVINDFLIEKKEKEVIPLEYKVVLLGHTRLSNEYITNAANQREDKYFIFFSFDKNKRVEIPKEIFDFLKHTESTKSLEELLVNVSNNISHGIIMDILNDLWIRRYIHVRPN